MEVYITLKSFKTGANMKIHDLSISIDTRYSDERWLRFCEEYVEVLKSSNLIIQEEISPVISYSNRGNFYGLLHDMNVPAKYHYLFLRLNGYRYPDEFDGNLLILNTIDYGYIDSLFAQYD